MITEFLYSFPIFFFALFATIQVSEMGLLISSNDLMSFYAARSHFVAEGNQEMVKNAVKQINDINRHPIKVLMGMKTKEKLPTITYKEINTHQVVKIKTAQFPLIEFAEKISHYTGPKEFDPATPLRKFQNFGFVSQTALPEREAGQK